MNRKFNTKSDILVHLHENMNATTLIDDIKLVMLSESEDIMNKTNIILKHSDIGFDKLAESLYIVESVIDKAISIDAQVSENVQIGWVKLKTTLENRINDEGSMVGIADRHFIDNCSGVGGPVNRCLTQGITHKLAMGDKPAMMEFINRLDKIDTENASITLSTLEDLIMVAINSCDAVISEIEDIIEYIKYVVNRTILNQQKDPSMYDLPYVKGLNKLESIFNSKYSQVHDMREREKCEKVFTAIRQTVSETISEINGGIMPMVESFSPSNPHSLNALTPMVSSTRKVEDIMMDIATAEDEKTICESLCELARLNTLYEMYGSELETVSEASKVAKKIRSVAKKTEKGTAKLKRASDNNKEIKDAAKKAVDPIATFIDKTSKQVKEADSAERRKQILNKGVVSKITRYIRRYIEVAGTGMVFGPTAAGIVLLGRLASDKHLDRKERAKMLRDRELELKLTREKIEDSKGEENKKAKYELMRIEDALEKEIDRIRYNLKY